MRMLDVKDLENINGGFSPAAVLILAKNALGSKPTKEALQEFEKFKNEVKLNYNLKQALERFKSALKNL